MLRSAILFLATAFSLAGRAQDASKYQPLYFTGGLDGLLFQSARIEQPGEDDELGTLRFAPVFNLGLHYHADAGNAIGFFTGLDIKNLGYVDRDGELRVKRRVYTLGLPLGIKFGDMPRKHYGFLGGGVDVPFNYREKRFTDRDDKQKFNDWFSDRTPSFLPYVFAGYKAAGLFVIKAQYYPGNFLNTDFTETVGGLTVRPYAGQNVNLFFVSLGFDVPSPRKRSKSNNDETPVVLR